ncbi:MAG: Trk system potassium transporter TrkA [Thermodesulfovibrionales bacterium]|nr:Trk system potassium transporter TrkA [Thermodesulfovibrionales bacterium]
MHVIIVGAGEVGYQIARFLSSESIDVVVIDRDTDKLKRISEELDVAVVEGEGGDSSVLKEAGAEKADMLLAVTNSDETNMIACLLAKAMFSIPRKIARIRNPDYYFNKEIMNKDNLDIDPVINPELEAAKAVTRLLEVPFASEVEDFENGAIKVIAVKLSEQSPLIGKPLKNIRLNLKTRFLIGLIIRDEKAIIPTGDDKLKAGDIVYLPVRKVDIPDIAMVLALPVKPSKDIMIIGGGKIGYYIASSMEPKSNVKIIEKDAERCKYLSRYLGKTLILHGDGADQKLLDEENISEMDVVVVVTNIDELNIMSALLAKKMGARKTISLVNRNDYIPLAHSLGLQSLLSPRMITASSIMRYIRKGDILSLTAIADAKAEIIEARISSMSPLVGRTLREFDMPKSTVIGAIIRGQKIIIPTGDDTLQTDDRLVVFTLKESIKSLESILV